MPFDISHIVQKWSRKAEGAREDYVAGVQRPRRNPIEAALQAGEKWRAKMQDPRTYEAWKKALASISFDEWVKLAVELGSSRYVDGVRTKNYKYERFASKWFPILERLVAEVRRLPDVTDADRERRMIEMVRKLKAAKGAWRT